MPRSLQIAAILKPHTAHTQTTEVSQNGCTPKSSIYMIFHIDHSAIGVPPLMEKKTYTTDHGFRNSLWATSPAALFFSSPGDGQLDLGESAVHDEFQYRTRASLGFFKIWGKGSLFAEKSSHKFAANSSLFQ